MGTRVVNESKASTADTSFAEFAKSFVCGIFLVSFVAGLVVLIVTTLGKHEIEDWRYTEIKQLLQDKPQLRDQITAACKDNKIDYTEYGEITRASHELDKKKMIESLLEGAPNDG